MTILGHAKRNEFTSSGKKLLGYGGSEAFQSPAHNFSPEVQKLMETVGVSVTRLKESFDVNFYPDWQLSRGVFFDKKNFGETKSSVAIRDVRYLMIFRRTD